MSAAYGVGDTYAIRNVDKLETDSQNIISNKANIENIIANLRSLSNSVKSNWENSLGADVESYLKNMEECIVTLENTLLPSVTKYSETLIKLHKATKLLQSNTVDSNKSFSASIME